MTICSRDTSEISGDAWRSYKICN